VDIAGVEIDASWLPDMYAWLTDPELNELAHVGEVTQDGQQRWFDSLESRGDYWIRGIARSDGTRLGAFGLRHITPYSAEVFAYVGPATARGAGIGLWTLVQCDEEAQRRGLVRLWASAASHNIASRRTLGTAGYVGVGVREDWGVFAEKLVPGRALTEKP
jgi:RimJ/RimL family protein N-acetyltransferase